MSGHDMSAKTNFDPAYPEGLRRAIPAVASMVAMLGLATADAQDFGASQASTDEFQSLDEEVQDLKQAVMDLNRDLFILEEELLFPANTQVAVFVSVDVGFFFALMS